MPDPRSTTKRPEAPSRQSAVRGRALRRLGLVGAAVVAVGAAAFGIDQAVSSTHSRGSNSPGSGSSATTLPGSLASLYLATTPTAVVSINLSSVGQGLGGTATVLATAGKPPTPNTDFVIDTVSAVRQDSRLDFSFNGGPKTSTRVDKGAFTVGFPLPDGTNVSLTFKPTTNKAIATAQAAFRQRVEPGSQTPAGSPTQRKLPASSTTTTQG